MGRPWLSLPTLQNRQNHAFFHVLAPNLLKNTRFSTFLASKCFSTFFQNHAFFHVLASNLLKNACFSTFLASKCFKATLFSTFWLQNCSKTRVFPRFGFRIPQKHACFHVFGFKTVRFSTFWLQNCSKTRVFQCFCLQSGSKPRVFPSFGFNIVQKRAFIKFFVYKLLQLFFDVFGLKRFKKPCFFAMCFVSKSLQCKAYFFTDRRLCTQVRRARKLLHTDDLHTKAFTHRLFCTTNCFTHISFRTPKHLKTNAFYRGLSRATIQIYTRKHLHTENLHTDNLHTDSFVQQTALHT